MLIQTEDDHSFINSSLFYYYALKEANIPVWMHLYRKGGHGYDLHVYLTYTRVCFVYIIYIIKK